MKIECTADMTAFRRGLRAKLRATDRAHADVVNRAARDVCLKAIKYTPAAGRAEIKQALLENGLAFRLLQSPRFQRRLPRRFQGFTRGTHSRKDLDAAVRAFIAQRQRTGSYVKAGWIKAAQVFGGATNRKVSNKGNAGKGYGKKATPFALAATGANLANGAPTVGHGALQQALNEVGNDTLAYARKKIGALWA